MKKQLELKDRKYVLNSTSTPISFYIPAKDTAISRLLHFDEEKKQQRALRYAKNQRSPFVDEQDDNVILESIVFIDGDLNVPKQNVQLQEFLALHPGNMSNGGTTFFEYNPEEVAAKNIEALNREVDALILAKTLDLNKMLSIGRVYLSGNVDAMSTAELELDNIAARAIAEEFVIVKQGKDIYYNLRDNKKKILTIPFGELPVNALAKWLHSEAGETFYTYLKKEFES